MELNILVIDDDVELLTLLKEYCAKFNMAVTGVETPSAGLRQLTEQSFDAVVLDGMLPEMDGFEVCKKIRQTSNIPIVMLTARGDISDRVLGLEFGANDYMVKPFAPRELIARLRATVSRNQVQDAVIRFPNLVIDGIRRNVFVYDNSVTLTDLEFRCLLLLAKRPSTTISRTMLLKEVHGITADIETRSTDILISRLRNKLRPIDCIRTTRGAGYMFIPPTGTDK